MDSGKTVFDGRSESLNSRGVQDLLGTWNLGQEQLAGSAA